MTTKSMKLTVLTAQGKKIMKQMSKNPTGFKISTMMDSPLILRIECRDRNKVRWFTHANMISMFKNVGKIDIDVDYTLEDE